MQSTIRSPMLSVTCVVCRYIFVATDGEFHYTDKLPLPLWTTSPFLMHSALQSGIYSILGFIAMSSWILFKPNWTLYFNLNTSQGKFDTSRNKPNVFDIMLNTFQVERNLLSLFAWSYAPVFETPETTVGNRHH